MIKSLTVTNFQSHQKTKLQLHPGVNVIVGSSDSGKSALIRALNWVYSNRPSGESFRSHWGGTTRTKVVVDDGTVVLRKRGKGINYYKVAGTKLKAFGSNVPDLVSKALNLTHVNFQFQLDAHYLLSKSAGDVARALNDVVDLNVIDESLTKINGELRNKTTTLGSVRLHRSHLMEKRAAIPDLSSLEEAIVQLEREERQVAALEQRWQQLCEDVSSAVKLEKSLQQLQTMPSSKQVSELQQQAERLEEGMNEKRALLEEYESLQDSLSLTEGELKQAQRELKQQTPNECPLCGRRKL